MEIGGSSRILAFVVQENPRIANRVSGHVFLGGVALPNLNSFSITGDSLFTARSIQYLFKRNPQVKDIEVRNCVLTSSEIFPWIVRNVPQIESISFMNNFNDRYELIDNAKHLKHLAALKTLKIGYKYYGSFSPVISAMAEVQAPLESLDLLDVFPDQELFMGISELKRLKTLRLSPRTTGWSTWDELIGMVCELCELTNLALKVNEISAIQLVAIVECAPKLRELELEVSLGHHFELETYEMVMNVLANRGERCHLQIVIKSKDNVLDIPHEMLKANEGLLTIRMQ